MPGKCLTEEQELERRRKISEAMKIRWQDTEFRTLVTGKLSQAAKRAYANGTRIPPIPNPKGSHLTEDTKKRMKGRTPWNKGLTKETDNRLLSMSEAGLKRKGGIAWNKGLRGFNANVERGPEWRRKISEGTKRQWQRMGAELLKASRRGMRVKPNKVERRMADILINNFPHEWQYTGDGRVIIENLIPDFVNVNGRKEIIEVFGDFWHGEKCTRPYKTEEERRKVFQKYGYHLLVIWEHELKQLHEEAIVAKIEL